MTVPLIGETGKPKSLLKSLKAPWGKEKAGSGMRTKSWWPRWFAKSYNIVDTLHFKLSVYNDFFFVTETYQI